jgi:deoxyribodipyrimidine photolyase-related protein
LAKHRKRFAADGRVRNQYLNPDRKTQADMRAMRSRADKLTAALL